MKMKKTLVLIIALVLIASLAVGGTLAYFTWTSDPVTNNFTVVGEGIDVVNPEGKLEPSWNEVNAKIIPGNVYAKDPQIMLSDETSVAVWVIFGIKEVNNTINTKQIVEYALNTELVEVDINDSYTYYAVKVSAATAKTVCLFQGGTTTDGVKSDNGVVTINPTLTNEDLAELAEDLGNDGKVQLVVQAWVIQALTDDAAADYATVMAAEG